MDSAAQAIQIAEAIIRPFEGCVLHPYQDQHGLWSIGYGCRYLLDGSPVTARTPSISAADADALLEHALAGTVARVRAAVDGDLDPQQWGALYSLAYNIGGGAFAGSTLCRLLNAGDTLGAAAQFLVWNHAGGVVDAGLTRRRAFEKRVFLGIENPLLPH